jgi:hypothetical protein
MHYWNRIYHGAVEIDAIYCYQISKLAQYKNIGINFYEGNFYIFLVEQSYFLGNLYNAY